MEGWILMSNKRLYRASQGAMISGVCQGIADYFKMDATIIRLIWIVVTIFSFGFAGVVLYIACIFIIPDQATVTHQQKQQPKSSVFDSSEYTVKDADKNDRV